MLIIGTHKDQAKASKEDLDLLSARIIKKVPKSVETPNKVFFVDGFEKADIRAVLDEIVAAAEKRQDLGKTMPEIFMVRPSLGPPRTQINSTHLISTHPKSRVALTTSSHWSADYSWARSRSTSGLTGNSTSLMRKPSGPLRCSTTLGSSFGSMRSLTPLPLHLSLPFRMVFVMLW